MRVMKASALAIALAVCTVAAQDTSKKIVGGGITAKGWQGRVDPQETKQGNTINDSKFMAMGSDLHVQTGPTAIYWNPSNTATGDYTVKATFTEGKSTSDHPHAAGLFIGGKGLDSETPNLVYCIAYGNGNALVRGFSGGKVFQVNRGPNEAVNKGTNATQEIAWVVKGDKVECLVNGKPVASLAKADLVGAGKLDSTDGIYGIRVGHNIEMTIKGLTKN